MTESEQNVIMYSRATYPKDGLTYDVLSENLEKRLKSIKE